uniref:CUB domain-containing protein n=1 Tax=Plectus sambesii TaxID=2011161 RepID=A0A914WLG8_9BILA
MSRSLAVGFVALALVSLCSAGVVQSKQPTCQGNADPYNNCKTVGCLPSKFGGTFVREHGPFTAPTSAASSECLWVLRPPNGQSITKLQFKSVDIAQGDVIEFHDTWSTISLKAGQSLDDINNQLHAFESRKSLGTMVFLKNGKNDGTVNSRFDLDYQFA